MPNYKVAKVKGEGSIEEIFHSLHKQIEARQPA
jgi:adenylate kinase